MPIYEYECKKCSHKFTERRGMNDENPKCPKCSSEVRKLISACNFYFVKK